MPLKLFKLNICDWTAFLLGVTSSRVEKSKKWNSSVPLSTFICSAGLSLMPSSALVELLHRVEAAIREYSEELIGQLARREELEFEKEVKNTFITALMEVQNRQKEQRDSSKRRRRDKALSLQGGGINTGSMGSMEKTGSMPVKVRSRKGLAFNTLHTKLRPLHTRLLHTCPFISVTTPELQ